MVWFCLIRVIWCVVRILVGVIVMLLFGRLRMIFLFILMWCFRWCSLISVVGCCWRIMCCRMLGVRVFVFWCLLVWCFVMMICFIRVCRCCWSFGRWW